MTRERLCWRSDLNTEGSVKRLSACEHESGDGWIWIPGMALKCLCCSSSGGRALSWPRGVTGTLPDHRCTPTPQQGCYLSRQHPFNSEFSIQAVFMDSLVQLNLTVLVTPMVLLCSSFHFHQLWGQGAIGEERISICTECQNKGAVLAPSKLCTV